MEHILHINIEESIGWLTGCCCVSISPYSSIYYYNKYQINIEFLNNKKIINNYSNTKGKGKAKHNIASNKRKIIKRIINNRNSVNLFSILKL